MGLYTGTPKTWTTNETVTAAMFNAELRDPLAALAGSWTAYTPSVLSWTLGNGTVAAYYQQFGKTVDYQIELTLGSTTVVAASLSLSLPVAAARSNGTVSGYFVDTSASAQWQAAAMQASGTTTVILGMLGTNGSRASLSSTAPFTWASTDLVRVSGRYEAA